MRQIFVLPNSYEMLGSVIKKDIDGVILPLKGFSVNSNKFYTMEEIKTILNLTSKKVCILINKIMHRDDLKELEDILVKLNKMNISAIFFYDLAVIGIVNRLMIKKPIIIWQDHLNLGSLSNNFYKENGVFASVVSNDLTCDEINSIKGINLMMVVYGYLPMMYSRRYLVSNYLEYINEDKGNDYFVINKDCKYRMVEEDNGTTMYTSEYINLINDIDKLNVKSIILNSNYIENDAFFNDLDKFINCKKDDLDHYRGFLDKQSVYRKCDYEKN